MKMKNYRLFNLIFLPLVAFNLLSIALVNLAVDPYGILKNLGIGAVNQSNLEREKPSPVVTPVAKPVAKAVNKQVKPKKPQMTLKERTKYRSERFKLNLTNLSITRIHPKTILLGTSTALRLSPDHPALTIQPAYNLALPGAKMYDIKSYFEDTLANQPDLKQVVIGIDFFSFGGPEKKITPVTPEKKIKPPITEVRKNKYSISLQELVKITFSIDTLKASLKKILANSIQSKQIDTIQPRRIEPSPKSSPENSKFNSLHLNFNINLNEGKKQVNKKANKEAKATKVRPKNKPIKKEVKKKNNKVFIPYRNNKKLNDFRRVIVLYWSEKTLYKNYNLSQEELDNLKEIIDICKQRKITLKIFFSPVHAAQLEAIHTAGLWPVFEEWKRQVVKMTPAWDFSDYSSITTEPINDEMENFVDSVHYQDQIADLILNRLYNYHKERVPPNFGPLITPANIESHLNKIRAERQAWLKTKPAAVKFVQDIKKQTNLKIGTRD
jgi:hypothetical protein